MADLFSELIECSYKGISFPYGPVGTKGAHNLAEHPLMDVDGVSLEATGRASYTFEVEAYFFNGLAPGVNETWGDGLYPQQFLKLIAALEERTTGEFVHPVYGGIDCKPVSWESRIDPDRRSGEILHIVFRESREGESRSLGSVSPFTTAIAAAGDLDAALGTLSPPIATGIEEDGWESFSDAMNQVSAIGDQISLAAQKVTGKLDSIATKVQNVQDSMGGALDSVVSAPGKMGDSVAKLGNTASQVRQTCDRLLSAIYEIQFGAALAAPKKVIKVYTTGRAQTLGAIASFLGASLTDILKLNPSLVAKPVIPSGTPINYYAP